MEVQNIHSFFPNVKDCVFERVVRTPVVLVRNVEPVSSAARFMA